MVLRAWYAQDDVWLRMSDPEEDNKELLDRISEIVQDMLDGR